MDNKKGSGNKRNPKLIRFLIYYSCITLVTMFIFNIFLNPLRTNKISYSEFEEMGRQQKIHEVQISSEKIYLTVKEEGKKETIYVTEKIEDPDLIKKLNQWGVKTYGGVPETRSPLAEFFVSWVLPIMFFMFIGRLLTGRMQKSMGGMGKSTAKEYNIENNTGITFGDVAGQEEAKNSLQEIVDYLHNPRKYKEIGAKLPKGELLVGPPGTGKTLLAKAVAGEAKVPFFSISGSEFVQMFVGMGAARVRDLFNQAKKKAPCIIFIDEIDAIGKSRDTRISGGNDEREQTLNQLLTEMDGFDSSENPVIVLAATNRPEVLDKALLRPGRFDRRVIVSKPDLMGRKRILEVHIKNVKLAEDVNLDSIARITSGSSGADLANIVNEAALRAVRNGRKEVTQRDLEEAMEVVFAGEAKKDRIMSQKERELVAYHEAGHALAGALQKNTDPVAKITIVPTTMGALGYTLQLPAEEKYLVSKEEIEERIVVMLAGRAAEEVKFDQITTGASNDIEKATQLARNMVTIYGMSDKFDMMGLETASNRYIDGSPMKNYGTETGKEIDEEVLSIIKNSHKKAKKLLVDNMALLERVSELLLEKETISGEEFYRIVNENS
ncbi:ATP-dependent zinc metalloprotease FtsH [Wukongibacter baidiensis]|uniref:ATP-dependent zinc metalloprotease FtsH n=1 Tax=Wukongibacter baidiensis TaxID=1723361 RepID=UPI003D7F64DD